MPRNRRLVRNGVLGAASSVLLLITCPALGQELVEGLWTATVTEPNGASHRLGLEVTYNDGQLSIEMIERGDRWPMIDVRAGGGTLAFSVTETTPCSLRLQDDGSYAGECGGPTGNARMVITPPGVGEPIELAADRPPVEAAIEVRPVDEVGAIDSPGGDRARVGEDGAANAAPVAHLGELLQRDLDSALERQLAVSRQEATEWQADARLSEVRLTIDDSGEIGWRFRWLSDASGRVLRLFSRAGSMRVGGEDPAAADKATLDPVAMVGFNAAVRALEAAGIDLAAITPAAINSFELSYQDWRDPAGFYYYLFLTSGAQHWIVAATGEMQD